MRIVVQAIKDATGMTIEQYCDKVLKTTYKSFSYRLRKGALKIDEYRQIIDSTDKTFEDLFGGAYDDLPKKFGPTPQTMADDLEKRDVHPKIKERYSELLKTGSDDDDDFKKTTPPDTKPPDNGQPEDHDDFIDTF